MAVAGLWLEREEGSNVDDISNQIRTNLSWQVIQLSPRIRLTNNEAFLNKLTKVASKYPGQKLQLFVNLNTADDREEVFEFAQQINMVLASTGWRDASGNKITFPPHSAGSNALYDALGREGVRGVGLHTWPDAPPSTSKAADEIANTLMSIGIMAYRGATTDNFSKSPHDVIEMTVARRLEL